MGLFSLKFEVQGVCFLKKLGGGGGGDKIPKYIGHRRQGLEEVQYLYIRPEMWWQIRKNTLTHKFIDGIRNLTVAREEDASKSWHENWEENGVFGWRAGPLFPRGPSRPLSPLGPCTLCDPLSPICPFGPSLPWGPCGPGTPGIPGVPFDPGMPGKPWLSIDFWK